MKSGILRVKAEQKEMENRKKIEEEEHTNHCLPSIVFDQSHLTNSIVKTWRGSIITIKEEKENKTKLVEG